MAIVLFILGMLGTAIFYGVLIYQGNNLFIMIAEIVAKISVNFLTPGGTLADADRYGERPEILSNAKINASTLANVDLVTNYSDNIFAVWNYATGALGDLFMKLGIVIVLIIVLVDFLQAIVDIRMMFKFETYAKLLFQIALSIFFIKMSYIILMQFSNMLSKVMALSIKMIGKISGLGITTEFVKKLIEDFVNNLDFNSSLNPIENIGNMIFITVFILVTVMALKQIITTLFNRGFTIAIYFLLSPAWIALFFSNTFKGISISAFKTFVVKHLEIFVVAIGTVFIVKLSALIKNTFFDDIGTGLLATINNAFYFLIIMSLIAFIYKKSENFFRV